MREVEERPITNGGGGGAQESVKERGSGSCTLLASTHRSSDFEAQMELPPSAADQARALRKMLQAARAYLREQSIKWFRCLVRRLWFGWGGIHSYWEVFFRSAPGPVYGAEKVSGAMGDSCKRIQELEDSKGEGALDKGLSTKASVDDDDQLRSTSSEELDTAERVGSGCLGSIGDLHSAVERGIGVEKECGGLVEERGVFSTAETTMCTGEVDGLMNNATGGQGDGDYSDHGISQGALSCRMWGSAPAADESETGLKSNGRGPCLPTPSKPTSGNGLETSWRNNDVMGDGCVGEWDVPRALKAWTVYLRLKDLAEQVDRPFRICVKGLPGNVRQIIRLSAFLAGFDTVNETKEKNMWLGQRPKQHASRHFENGDICRNKRSGRELPSYPTLEEMANLHDICESQIPDMNTQIQQAIVTYLRTWMTDVSEIFKRSETCCTSLELNCFLMPPEWVLHQASDLAESCSLTAVPVSNGHLKIQKASESVHCAKVVQTDAQEMAKSQIKLAHSKPSVLVSGGKIFKSLVVERLQDCYMSKQREHIFILDVSSADIRQHILNIARAIGFTASKITAKGKFVASRGRPRPGIGENNDSYSLSQADIGDMEKSIQRGVRSFLLSWFAHIEKTNISSRLLTTSSFLMPEHWVERVAKRIAGSISVEVRTKSPGTLEVTRKEYSAHDNSPQKIWMLEKSMGGFVIDRQGPRVDGIGKVPEFSSSAFLENKGHNHAIEIVPKFCHKFLQASHPDQVGVWNQLKYLYKQKRQGAHLVWADGLQKHVKETICRAGLKLGFTSTQDLGPYIRLSRFDCLVPGEPSSEKEHGCKLRKLAATLRKQVVGLDSEIIPIIEAHMDTLLRDFVSSHDFGIRVELEKYPLPEAWVVQIVEKCVKKVNHSSGQLYTPSCIVVLKKHQNGIAHLEKTGESNLEDNITSTAAPICNSKVGQHLSQVPACGKESFECADMMEPMSRSGMLAKHLGQSLVHQSENDDQASTSIQFPKSTLSCFRYGMDAKDRLSCSYYLPAYVASAGREKSSFCCGSSKNQEDRALSSKSPQNHDLTPATSQDCSALMEFDIPALSHLPILENFYLHPNAVSETPTISCVPQPVAYELSQWCSQLWNPKNRGGHMDQFRQDIECKRVSFSLSTLPLQAKVHYVKTLEDMAFWCNYIYASKVAVIGIDTEWKPNLNPGDNHPVALIQICFRVLAARESRAPTYICILFHVHHSSFTASFVALLENYSIMKVGVQIDMDVHKVRRDHLIEMNNCVELYTEAGEKGIYARGLKGLVAEVLHHDLPKNKSVTLSNWEESPLTQQQKQYAAYDAYAALRVFEELHGIGASA